MSAHDTTKSSHKAASKPLSEAPKVTESVKEFGGRKEGLEPTRYGDWEKNGRCIDF